jgi:hypothetical protein
MRWNGMPPPKRSTSWPGPDLLSCPRYFSDSINKIFDYFLTAGELSSRFWCLIKCESRGRPVHSSRNLTGSGNYAFPGSLLVFLPAAAGNAPLTAPGIAAADAPDNYGAPQKHAKEAMRGRQAPHLYSLPGAERLNTSTTSKATTSRYFSEEKPKRRKTNCLRLARDGSRC